MVFSLVSVVQEKLGEVLDSAITAAVVVESEAQEKEVSSGHC